MPARDGDDADDHGGPAGDPHLGVRRCVSPRLMTLAYTSWANDADAVIVRPATTARIVANATAEMIPSMISPPSW